MIGVRGSMRCSHAQSASPLSSAPLARFFVAADRVELIGREQRLHHQTRLVVGVDVQDPPRRGRHGSPGL
jgi:hypothetical protein